jgi:hypothetical protein
MIIEQQLRYQMCTVVEAGITGIYGGAKTVIELNWR